MEDAKMTPFILSPRYFLATAIILLGTCAFLPAQGTSQQQPGFYDVQMTKEEVRAIR
jgi:3'-phosphoadenosine 5'-phosphosulfate sulfotransferase